MIKMNELFLQGFFLPLSRTKYYTKGSQRKNLMLLSVFKKLVLHGNFFTPLCDFVLSFVRLSGKNILFQNP